MRWFCPLFVKVVQFISVVSQVFHDHALQCIEHTGVVALYFVPRGAETKISRKQFQILGIL